MRHLLLALLLPVLAVRAEVPQERAVDSLLRVRAAAQAAAGAAGQGRPLEAASALSVPFEGAAPAADAVLVPAPPLRPRPPLKSEQNPNKGTDPNPNEGTDPFLGLYRQSDFELTTGRRCNGCNAPVEGTWLFLDDVIAVPKVGPPALIWIGSTRQFDGVTLAPDGRSATLQDGTVLPLELVQQGEYNKSYYDASSTAYLQGRKLRIRGELVEEGGERRLVARTIWPEDWRLDLGNLVEQPASTDEDVRALVQQDDGGARAPFMTRVLWAKDRTSAGWAGRPVLGVMVNGAQGDDDEAHYGHFSYMSGRIGPRGEMADWMFSNFYSLDVVSEKNILPALVPLDKYMADLNSGQSWYRPTGILVAVLKDERVAAAFQERFRKLYADYYAHRVIYDRTTKACTALIMDELRGEGWSIPKRGGSDPLSAGVMRLIMTLAADAQAGREIWGFMREETTRLSPRAAFEAVGEDLLQLAGANGASVERELSPLEKMLQDDLEAILYVRIPQIPSSREFGRDPAGTIFEYFGRVPMDQSKWKKAKPTPDRPYPPPHRRQGPLRALRRRQRADLRAALSEAAEKTSTWSANSAANSSRSDFFTTPGS